MLHYYPQHPSVYLGSNESGEVWCQVKNDALFGARQGHSSEEQDYEHHVGEESGEVHHLSTPQHRGEVRMSRSNEAHIYGVLWQKAVCGGLRFAIHCSYENLIRK